MSKSQPIIHRKTQPKTRWGIIGPGSIARNFADGLAQSASGVLTAIAGRDRVRRDAFGDDFAVAPGMRHSNYHSLIAEPSLDAVYIATPHPFHAEIAIKVMQAGKAVLVEKPAALNAAQVVALCEVATLNDVFFMEGYMYRCHPQIARMLEIITSGEIGTLRHIRTSFGFAARFDPASRIFDPALGGGGILDVGGYPVSLARLVAGAAVGKPFAEPVSVKGSGIIGASGVDEVAYGLLGFEGGFSGEIACAVTRNMDNNAVIIGDKGRIELVDPWTPGRNAGPSDATIIVTVGAKPRKEVLRHADMLFAFEAEVASRAIADGLKQAPFPAMSPSDSIANNTVLDQWRAELGYLTPTEDPKQNRPLPPLFGDKASKIPTATIDGVSLPVSRLVIGCDNKNSIGSGAVVWDAWIEAGGNAFDTGFVYGGGLHEGVLGQWLANRGAQKEVVVIAKGAHSPYCTPRAVTTQLEISLDRLGLDNVPIYIMHRDNPEVPVGEFMDVLNQLHDAGKIGIFGGSNWSIARTAEANAYAAKHGLRPMRILNNNLSLAVMERPIWQGCISANTPETLEFLYRSDMVHLSWSSSARGYFLPAELRNRLPVEIGPDACFGSVANAERRRRAEQLATRYGVSAHNIATAWVLSQNFASFALVGPRSPGEIASTLPALSVRLSSNEVAWLNLEVEDLAA